jgi:hypothetical protein
MIINLIDKRMKKMKTICAVLLVLLISVPAIGQEMMPYISYTISQPTSDFGDWIGETSYYGFEIGSRSFANNNFSWGFATGWTSFSEKLSGTTQLDSGAITGTSIRSMQTFPLLLSAHYYFGRRTGARPYVGLNTGVYFISYTNSLGVIISGDTNAHFGITPELGIIVPVGDYGLMLNAKYVYALEGGGPMDFTWVALNIGMTFPDF